MRVAAHVSVSDHRRTLLVDYLYQFKSKTQLHNLVSMISLSDDDDEKDDDVSSHMMLLAVVAVMWICRY